MTGWVQVLRGGVVESRHAVTAAIAQGDGRLVGALGDPTLVTFPRSSLKPFQALALLETGAAAAFDLDDRHLALACASHDGEPFHVALVEAWLGRIGAGADDLACGAQPPHAAAAADALVRAGRPFTRLHHNCSGKHTGFLCVCRHQGWPLAGYADPAHPAQRRYLDTLQRLAGLDAPPPLGIDGCRLPAPALPIAAVATAIARFATTARDQPESAEGRLLAAMGRHPELVSGTGDRMVQLTHAAGDRVIVKEGAEGFLAAWLPEAGLGIALKVHDGNSRAIFPALVELLATHRLLDATTLPALATLRRPPVQDSEGHTVGHIEPSFEAAPARP